MSKKLLARSTVLGLWAYAKKKCAYIIVLRLSLSIALLGIRKLQLISRRICFILNNGITADKNIRSAFSHSTLKKIPPKHAVC